MGTRKREFVKGLGTVTARGVLDFLIQAGDHARDPMVLVAGTSEDICRDLWRALFSELPCRRVDAEDGAWLCLGPPSTVGDVRKLFAQAHIVLVTVSASRTLSESDHALWESLLPGQMGFVVVCSKREGERAAWTARSKELEGAWRVSREKIVAFVRDTQAGVVDLAARIYRALPVDLAAGFARVCVVPAVKTKDARRIARQSSVKAAVIGGIPIPFPDIVLLTPLQMRMVHRIARLYGYKLASDQARELLGVIAGGMLLRTTTRQALKFLPGLGPMIAASVAFAGTMAVGEAARAYFASGKKVKPDKLRSIYRSVMKEARANFEGDKEMQKRIRRLCLQYEAGAISREEFERELDKLGLTPTDLGAPK